MTVVPFMEAVLASLVVTVARALTVARTCSVMQLVRDHREAFSRDGEAEEQLQQMRSTVTALQDRLSGQSTMRLRLASVLMCRSGCTTVLDIRTSLQPFPSARIRQLYCCLGVLVLLFEHGCRDVRMWLYWFMLICRNGCTSVR